MKPSDVSSFITADHRKWLFPLASVEQFNRLGSDKISTFINDKVFGPSDRLPFLRCPVEYALKDALHLRKALILDPLATHFLYRFALEHKTHFRLGGSPTRHVYGYGFSRGKPIDSFADYHRFRRRRQVLKREYRHFAHVDVANCFNSFYHHSIVAATEGVLGIDASQQLGQFLREINGGESINCFPQGSYPAKVIGNWYLGFLEDSAQVRSSVMLRFIDDIALFDNSPARLVEDVLLIQRLLATRALALNAEKTRLGRTSEMAGDADTDEIKKRLLQKREDRQGPYDVDGEDESSTDLEEEEVEYIEGLIGHRNVAEEDVELALSLVRDEPAIQLQLAKLVIARFPHLLKTLHAFLGHVSDPGSDIAVLIAARVRRPSCTPHELFWLARIVIDHFEWNGVASKLLLPIYMHAASTPIVKAAILETEHTSFGFDDLRQEALRADPVGLIGMACIAGLRSLPKAKRNHILKYVAHSGAHVSLLCDIIHDS